MLSGNPLHRSLKDIGPAVDHQDVALRQLVKHERRGKGNEVREGLWRIALGAWRLVLRLLALCLHAVTIGLACFLLWKALNSDFWPGFMAYGADWARIPVAIVFLVIVFLPSYLGAKLWGYARELSPRAGDDLA